MKSELPGRWLVERRPWNGIRQLAYAQRSLPYSFDKVGVAKEFTGLLLRMRGDNSDLFAVMPPDQT